MAKKKRVHTAAPSSEETRFAELRRRVHELQSTNPRVVLNDFVRDCFPEDLKWIATAVSDKQFRFTAAEVAQLVPKEGTVKPMPDVPIRRVVGGVLF